MKQPKKLHRHLIPLILLAGVLLGVSLFYFQSLASVTFNWHQVMSIRSSNSKLAKTPGITDPVTTSAPQTLGPSVNRLGNQAETLLETTPTSPSSLNQ